MSVDFRLTAIYTIGRRKAFYRQRIPESSCARKETVDIEIMQSIRITSRPTTKERKWNKLSQFRWTSAKVIPLEKTYAGYIQTMSQRFKSSREVASEGLTILILQFQVENRGTCPNVTTLFHVWAYGRFIEIQSKLRRKKLDRTNQGQSKCKSNQT